MKLLAIGDPHFRTDNIQETKDFTEELKQYLEKNLDIDTIIVLGDILHTHEKLHTDALNAAVDFFKTAKNIYANWNTIKQELVRCDQDPTTDVVYAITAKIIGIEKCLIPTLDFSNFTHMKPRIQGWSDDQPWTEHVNVEHDGTMIRINNLNQYHPVHYYEKDFIK